MKTKSCSLLPGAESCGDALLRPTCLMVTKGKVLVFGSTGRQGGACVDALLARGGYEVHAIMRNPESAKSKALVERNVILHTGDLKKPLTIEAAMRDSGATMVFLFTMYAPFKNSAKDEQAQGIAALDAIAAVNPAAFLVFASVNGADEAPAAVKHFHSKAAIEKHLKASAIKRWFILRPSCFYENVDDPANSNPLKKGKVKMLSPANVSIAYISCPDIGKAAATAFADPDAWAGKTVKLAAATYTGIQLAEAMAEVTGTPTSYGTAVPGCVLKCMVPDLAAMVAFMEDGEFAADYEDSKKLVPDIMDAKAWFTSKGAYRNGEKFKTSTLESATA